jgi:hypothetical protein
MPKKKQAESPEAQAKRFREEAKKLMDAGELDPTEAEEGLDRVVKEIGKVERGD